MKLIRKILLWFYYLTPKGREEKYFAKIEKNIDAYLLEQGKKELSVKQKCVAFAKKNFTNKMRSEYFRQKTSNFKIGKVTSEKYKEELNDVKVAIDSNLNFKDI